MKCRIVRQRFADLSKDKDDAEVNAQIAEHLNACRDCSEAYQSYLDVQAQIDKQKIYVERFGRDPNDFFMVSLRRKISQEVVQKQKKQLAFWSLFGKFAAGAAGILLVGQVMALQRGAVYQRRITELLERQLVLEKTTASLKEQLGHIQFTRPVKESTFPPKEEDEEVPSGSSLPVESKRPTPSIARLSEEGKGLKKEMMGLSSSQKLVQEISGGREQGAGPSSGSVFMGAKVATPSLMEAWPTLEGAIPRSIDRVITSYGLSTAKVQMPSLYLAAPTSAFRINMGSRKLDNLFLPFKFEIRLPKWGLILHRKADKDKSVEDKEDETGKGDGQPPGGGGGSGENFSSSLKGNVEDFKVTGDLKSSFKDALKTRVESRDARLMRSGDLGSSYSLKSTGGGPGDLGLGGGGPGALGPGGGSVGSGGSSNPAGPAGGVGSGSDLGPGGGGPGDLGPGGGGPGDLGPGGGGPGDRGPGN